MRWGYSSTLLRKHITISVNKTWKYFSFTTIPHQQLNPYSWWIIGQLFTIAVSHQGYGGDLGNLRCPWCLHGFEEPLRDTFLSLPSISLALRSGIPRPDSHRHTSNFFFTKNKAGGKWYFICIFWDMVYID